MTATEERPATPVRLPAAAEPPQTTGEGRSRGWFLQLLLRLHFLAGLFVGPFLLVAALSGAAYAAAPWVESVVYQHELTAPSRGAAQPLAAQVDAAQRFLADRRPADVLTGVQPAAHPGATTQVLFSEPGLMDGRTRSVWVDPVTARPRGDLLVSGTALPIRTWLDVFHRTLFLGDVGRLYSETAASWLGVVALAGLGLWVRRIRRTRSRRRFVLPERRARGYRRVLSWHAATGVWLLVGALFLSATGITWSLHAGARVDALVQAVKGSTPVLDTSARDATSAAADGAAQRAGRDLAALDAVLARARAVNVHAAEVQVDLPAGRGQAWTVSEIRRTYPTAISAVAIDGVRMSVVSRTDFASYPLAAKLTRWGIDTHMGLMWGTANQIVLLVTALGIAAMVVFGYVMWWQRRPVRGAPRRFGRAPAAGALARAPRLGVAAVLAASVLIGWLLPTVGVPLVAFVLLDALASALRPGAAAVAR